MRRLTHPLLVLLAIVFLIEAWLWRHLGPVVTSIVARIPLRALKAWMANTIRKLPPPAALIVFIVPVILLAPLKFIGLWLLAQKQWLAASLLLVFAKLVGVAVTAFVFEMARPKLLQMNWFRRLYERVLVALAWSHRLVAPVRRRIRRLLRMFGPRRASRTLRLLWRIRRRMRGGRRTPGTVISPGAARGAPTVQAP
jgi:hypothetical protein